MFRLFAALVVLGLVTAAHAAEIETPSYEVLAADGDVEVRRYAPVIEAVTTVEAPDARAAANKAFMTVARYIFGENETAEGGSAKIDMTAPVRTTAGTRIDMTAPVRTTAPGSLDDGGGYTIAFVMPSKWTLATLPKPKGDAVQLREVPAETLATLRFSGERGPDEIAEVEQRLRDWTAANGWTVTGPAGLAGYDGPSVASGERRYEVTLPVEKQ